MGEIKLHLGCGKRIFEGYIHIDGGNFSHLDAHDITKLNYDDNTVDLIYASHVIEYFDREEVIPLLNEWYRVLKPNGIFRIAVPDFSVISNLYVHKGYNIEMFLGLLYGKMKMADTYIYHKTCYDVYSLKILLFKIGFKQAKEYDWKQTEHAHIDDHSHAYFPHDDEAMETQQFRKTQTLISLNIECRK